MGIKGVFRRTSGLDVDKVTTPRATVKALRRALDRQETRLRDIGGEVFDVQLLGQATAAAEWPDLLAYWQRRPIRQGRRSGRVALSKAPGS